MGEARRIVGDLPEAQHLVVAVGVDHDHRRVRLADMTIDALVRDVQPLAIAVEEFPELFRGKMRLGVRVAGVTRQPGHGGTMSKADWLYNSLISCTYTIMETEPAGPRIRPVPAVTRAVAILRLLGRNRAPMGVKA